MSAIQHCKELKEYRAANRYQRKVSEGKNEMLVINNVCNKLVHRIFACVSLRENMTEIINKHLHESLKSVRFQCE